MNRASKKLEGISSKQKEELSSPEPDVVDNLTKAKKKKRLVPTPKKVSFENSPSVSAEKSGRSEAEVSSPEPDVVQSEIVDDVSKVKKKKRQAKTTNTEGAS